MLFNNNSSSPSSPISKSSMHDPEGSLAIPTNTQLAIHQCTIQSIHLPSLPMHPPSAIHQCTIQKVHLPSLPIQSHLITILPGLIQGEVCTQYSQLARQIGNQITSIWKEFEEGERDHHRSQQPNNRDEGDEDEVLRMKTLRMRLVDAPGNIRSKYKLLGSVLFSLALHNE